MSIKKQTQKLQKPIEHDIHLKYICRKCGTPHWLSFKEASTKNFKIVCDCGLVFGVKRVLDFKLKFLNKPKSQPTQKTIEKVFSQDHTIPIDLLNKTIGVLVQYGFTDNEAKQLIIKSYSLCPNNEITSLVKQVLESLRSENVK